MDLPRLDTVRGSKLLESAVFFSNSLSGAGTVAVIERGLQDAAKRHEISPDVLDAAVAGLAKPGQSADEAARFFLAAGVGAGYADQVTTAVAGAGKKQGMVDRGVVSSAVVAGLLLVLERANPRKMVIEIDRDAGSVRLQLEDTDASYFVGKDLALLLRKVGALSGPPATRITLRKTGIEDVVAMLRGMDRITLSDCVVVGNYLRYDPPIRSKLKGYVTLIQTPLVGKTDARENFLIWAAPGSGKTFLVQEIARDLKSQGKPVFYEECNLAKDQRDDFVRKLNGLAKQTNPVLCLLDEIDKRAEEEWPYEECFPKLDLNTEPNRQVAIVLVGSSESSVKSMAEAIKKRKAGGDLLSRVLIDEKSFEIPGLTTQDGATMVVGQIAALTSVKCVAKLALLYILCNDNLKSSPRQLTEFVKAAAGRVGARDHLQFHNLFLDGDPGSRAFDFRRDNESLFQEFEGFDVIVSP